MQTSRIKNTKRNIFASYIFTIVYTGFSFISRFFVVRIFGKDYLGLSNLYVSILTVLSMAEMGFCTAMVYNMYKPIAEGNIEKVCALLNYYKKVYRIIGTVVMVAGLLLVPFIPKLIHGQVPKGVNIYVLYLLYLINSAVSYFLFAYKSSLLEALQRQDLKKNVYSIVSLVRYVLQIVAIVVFKNYYLFVVLLIMGTAGMNIFSAIVAKKRYPEYTCRGTLDFETKKSVKKRVKGLLVGVVTEKTYSTLDSIILSIYIGLNHVAIYNNYQLIYASVLSILDNIRTAMVASVGNSVAVENVEKNYNDMILFQFLFSSIALVFATCMFNLYQPFMTLWMGKDMLLSQNGVILFCSWFVICATNSVYNLYVSASGLWWEMRFSYICSGVFNIIFNIVLGKFWGINGIILASVLANLIFGLFWQCRVVFKCYFKTGYKHYIIKQFYYYALIVVSCIISYYICKHIQVNRFFALFVKGGISVVVSFVVFFLGNFKTQIYKKGISFVIGMLPARLKRLF